MVFVGYILIPIHLIQIQYFDIMILMILGKKLFRNMRSETKIHRHIFFALPTYFCAHFSPSELNEAVSRIYEFALDKKRTRYYPSCDIFSQSCQIPHIVVGRAYSILNDTLNLSFNACLVRPHNFAL
jgi:hypothetical protein